MGLKEAAVEAARLRFRPIVMTSLAFILGVLPLALSHGRRRREPALDRHGRHRRHARGDVHRRAVHPAVLRLDDARRRGRAASVRLVMTDAAGVSWPHAGSLALRLCDCGRRRGRRRRG